MNGTPNGTNPNGTKSNINMFGINNLYMKSYILNQKRPNSLTARIVFEVNDEMMTEIIQLVFMCSEMTDQLNKYANKYDKNYKQQPHRFRDDYDDVDADSVENIINTKLSKSWADYRTDFKSRCDTIISFLKDQFAVAVEQDGEQDGEWKTYTYELYIKNMSTIAKSEWLNRVNPFGTVRSKQETIRNNYELIVSFMKDFFKYVIENPVAYVVILYTNNSIETFTTKYLTSDGGEYMNNPQWLPPEVTSFIQNPTSLLITGGRRKSINSIKPTWVSTGRKVVVEGVRRAVYRNSANGSLGFRKMSVGKNGSKKMTYVKCAAAHTRTTVTKK